MNQTTFTCKTCGKEHAGPPLVYGMEAPAWLYTIPEEERRKRAVLTSDQCIIDDKQFFILGRVEIPIIGREETFCWLSWVSLSEQNYDRACELWSVPGRENEPPYFGWLSSALPYEPTTIGLKTRVHTRPVGQRPFIELERTNHPLAIDQRVGVTFERVCEIAEVMIHEMTDDR